MKLRPISIFRRSFSGNGYLSGKTGIKDLATFVPSEVIVSDRKTGINSATTKSNEFGEFTVSGLDPTREYVITIIDIVDDGVDYNPAGRTAFPTYY